MNAEAASGKSVKCSALLERFTVDEIEMAVAAYDALVDCCDDCLTKPQQKRMFELGLYEKRGRMTRTTDLFVSLLSDMQDFVRSNAYSTDSKSPKESALNPATNAATGIAAGQSGDMRTKK